MHFGTEYIQRNRGDALLASNLDFFAKALRGTRGVRSCIEFGANIGMNLRALKLLYPVHRGVRDRDQPRAAAQQLAERDHARACLLRIHSRLPVRSDQWDLALIKGVLIHINPDALPDVYDKLVAATHRYLLVAEYYNPSPVAIPYRGHSDRLFKRDFAGEIMDRHPQMQLLDYGFAYRRDPNFPQDDITWFLMEKR